MEKTPKVISTRALRRLIGVIGTTLPFAVMFGGMLADVGLERSISHYYHTPMRDLYVAALAAIGVFLVSYRGYTNSPDNVVTNLAGGALILTALFPTDAGEKTWVGIVHLASAATALVLLAIMCLFFFTKSDGDLTPQKRVRNRVYLACGGVMVASLAWIVVNWRVHWLDSGSLIGETVALVAFGSAWFVKGDALWVDQD